jgi:hypothetical protein
MVRWSTTSSGGGKQRIPYPTLNEGINCLRCPSPSMCIISIYSHTSILYRYIYNVHKYHHVGKWSCFVNDFTLEDFLAKPTDHICHHGFFLWSCLHFKCPSLQLDYISISFFSSMAYSHIFFSLLGLHITTHY